MVLKLNERLLPYAVLFGLEREWVRELAALYEARGETPGWYSGRDGFNAAAFSVAVSVVLVGVELVVVGLELELVVERLGRRRLLGRRRRRRRRRRRLIVGAVSPRRRRGSLVAEVDPSLGVDAGDLVGETVVERAVVVVGRELVLVELGVLRHREVVVVLGRDGVRPREIVHG